MYETERDEQQEEEQNSVVALTKFLNLQLEEDEELEERDRLMVTPNPLIARSENLEGLSQNQENFLMAKLMGVTDKAAAEAAGISPHTAYGWKQKDENFREVYDAILNEPLEFSAGSLAYMVNKAMLHLSLLLDHKSTKVKQYAIDRIIDVAGLKKSRMEVTHSDERAQLDALRKGS